MTLKYLRNLELDRDAMEDEAERASRASEHTAAAAWAVAAVLTHIAIILGEIRDNMESK